MVKKLKEQLQETVLVVAMALPLILVEAMGQCAPGRGLKLEARWPLLPETIWVVLGNPGITGDGGRGSPCPICEMLWGLSCHEKKVEPVE